MDKEVEIKEKQASWLNPGFAKQYLGTWEESIHPETNGLSFHLVFSS